MENLETRVLAKRWFYPYRLPSGRTAPTYVDDAVLQVHSTRLRMLSAALEPTFGTNYSEVRALDLACHQGFFSVHLAQCGCRSVLGIDVRQAHVDDCNLIRDVLGLSNLDAVRKDIHGVSAGDLGSFDIVLMLGLIYHLENPVGAIRTARSLTKHVCLIETQVVPNLSGQVDWGSYQFVKPLQGCFGIVDETAETHGPEASVTGICLAPSLEGLLWIMTKTGFSRVEVIPVPENAYEQHRFGKRVMVAGYV